MSTRKNMYVRLAGTPKIQPKLHPATEKNLPIPPNTLQKSDAKQNTKTEKAFKQIMKMAPEINQLE